MWRLFGNLPVGQISPTHPFIPSPFWTWRRRLFMRLRRWRLLWLKSRPQWLRRKCFLRLRRLRRRRLSANWKNNRMISRTSCSRVGRLRTPVIGIPSIALILPSFPLITLAGSLLSRPRSVRVYANWSGSGNMRVVKTTTLIDLCPHDNQKGIRVFGFHSTNG